MEEKNEYRYDEEGNLIHDHSITWDIKLKESSDTIKLLEAYSKWLEKQGYINYDWNDEHPFAIDEFLKTLDK